MRRMLDPKEAGGSVKLYNHFIEIGTKDSELICFNYTSTDETKLTKGTILSALKHKALICAGYVKVNDAAKTPQYIYAYNNGSNDMLSVKWIDMATLSNSTKDIRISYLTDQVFPVS